jgi:hypothetical protein
VQEECPGIARNINICLLKDVGNPLGNELATVWKDIGNETFQGPLRASATSATSSTSSESVVYPTRSTLAATGTASRSSERTPTPTASAGSGEGSRKVSVGVVAAGTAIGALVGVGLAVAGALFVTRRYAKKMVAAEEAARQWVTAATAATARG